MSDLVERLHSNANDWQVEANRSLMEEAADEIESLRTQLAECRIKTIEEVCQKFAFHDGNTYPDAIRREYGLLPPLEEQP